MKQLSALLLTLVVITPHVPLSAVLIGTTAISGSPASKAAAPFTAAQFVPSTTVPILALNNSGDVTGLDADQKLYAIALASLGKDANGNPAVSMTPLAPDTPTVDGTPVAMDASPFWTVNGVSGIALPADASFGAAFFTDVADAAAAGGLGNVFNVDPVTANISTSGILNDAAGAALISGTIYAVEAANNVGVIPPAVAVAANNNLTFAAVSTVGWVDVIALTPPDTGRGIAIVGTSDTAPATVVAAAVAKAPYLGQRAIAAVFTPASTGANNAVAINMLAAVQSEDCSGALAFQPATGIDAVGNPALVANATDNSKMPNALAASTVVDLHWSDKLQRLYIGMDVQGSAAGTAAGVAGNVDFDKTGARSGKIKASAISFSGNTHDIAANGVSYIDQIVAAILAQAGGVDAPFDTIPAGDRQAALAQILAGTNAAYNNGFVRDATTGNDRSTTARAQLLLERINKNLGAAGGNTDGSFGGIVSVGTVAVNAAGAATFQSLVNNNTGPITPMVALFPDSDATRVIGVTRTSMPTANILQATASKVRTMATSTNKDYLIVNSVVNLAKGNTTGSAISVLAALPLVGTAAPAVLGSVGCLAAVDPITGAAEATFTKLPAAPNEVPNAIDAAVKIAPNLLNHSDIADLFVDGDTVYISMNNSTDATPTQRGLFRSTALFNKEGAIIGWTPGERVGGDLGVVQGAGYDAVTGNLYALTSADAANAVDGSPINTIKISQWGAADAAAPAAPNPANNLGSVLEPLYPAASGGIHSIATFNEQTVGFNNGLNDYQNSKLSVMAAVGKDQVSLIQAGVGGAAGSFLPTTDFSEAKKVFTYGADAATAVDVSLAAPALGAIAPLSCVELSRSRDLVANTGYAFIGGYNGLAVAAGAVAGVGYDNAAAVVGAAGNIANVLNNVVQLQPTTASADDFTDIRKLVAVRTLVFVMTGKNLYGFSVTNGLAAGAGAAAAAAKFSPVPAAALNEHQIDLTGFGIPASAVLYDMVAIDGGGDILTLILATSNGVYYGDIDAGADDVNFGVGGVVIPVVHAGQAYGPANGAATMPALQLNYLSANRSQPSPQGNLFALYADLENPGTGTVLRYAVNVNAAFVADTVRLVYNVDPVPARADEAPVPNVNSFTLSNIQGGFSIGGNTIFQARSFDTENGGPSVAGLVMNSALDASGTPKSAALSSAAINALVDGTVKFLSTPVVDPATGFVMVPHQEGVIANQ